MIPIPDFPGYYVTEDGHVYSEKSHKFLKEGKTRLGYARVNLMQDGKVRTQEVHRLVAAAYLGPANGRHVLHGRNGIEDNSVDNLRYGTINDNTRDRMRDNVRPKEDFVPVLSEADILDIRWSLALGEGTAKEIANWFGVSEETVLAVQESDTTGYRTL